jgi:hypothetical protein
MSAIPKRLVVIDPEAPAGFRRVSYGPVLNGKPLRSPAMRKLVQGLLRDQVAVVEQERLDAEWVAQQLASAPPLTEIQKQGLQRLKRDLTKAARSRMDEPARMTA